MKIVRFCWQVVYNILFHCALPILGCFQLWALRKGEKEWSILKSRLAMYPPLDSPDKPVIWFHGASLGEVLALIPLMEAMRKEFDHTQVISVTTVRGEYIAKEKSGAQRVLFLPLDLPYVVARAFNTLRPKAVIILETEIWPNLFWQSAKRNIPLFLVSGRISPRSFPRYRLAKAFFSAVLTDGNYLMRSEQDMQRIITIGAPSENVCYCGDIKYDGLRTELSNDDKQKLQSLSSLEGQIVIAGSTHDKEEEMVVDIFQDLVAKHPQTTLIIAPRHLERLAAITTMLREKGIEFNLRSSLPACPAKVIVLDTYGELAKVYALAHFVIMGGTFARIGGHNVMEPAAFGKPVICGPHYFNFRRHVQSLQENDAISLVRTPEQLADKCNQWLADHKLAVGFGQRAREVVLANQGALQNCIDKILPALHLQ